MLKVSQQSWCYLPFSLFSLHCTYCFHLNNNLPVTQHSQKNQTHVPEKQRPDSSIGFWMPMVVNQWCFLKMSCRTRTEQQPLSAASVIPLLWFTLYEYPNKQVCCQEYSGERQNVEKSHWTLTLNGEISSWQFDHRRCPGLCPKTLSAQGRYPHHMLGTVHSHTRNMHCIILAHLKEMHIFPLCCLFESLHRKVSLNSVPVFSLVLLILVSGCRWSSNQDFATITRISPLSETSKASSISW